MSYSFLRPRLRHDPSPCGLPPIPKTIWQVTNPTRQSVPKISEAIGKLRADNPGWLHVCNRDDELDDFFAQVASERLLRALARLSPDYPQTRIDIYRYLRLFVSGGVYFDDKSGASRPLDAIIAPDDRFLISQTAGRANPGWLHNLRSGIGRIEGGEFHNWFIASVPGHPFLAEVLETVLSRIETYSPLFSGTGKRSVLALTGPLVYTQAIAPIREQHPHRMILDRDAGLVYSLLPDTRTHEALFQSHYSTLYSPPVLSTGIPAFRRFRFESEKLLILPVAAARKINNARRRRRRARRERR